MVNLKVAAATLLLLAHVNLCSGRPAILQEQTIGYYTNFFKGCGVGVETVLSLLGYYEDEVVKANLASKTLDVDAADEEDQTSIQIAGLGLGRTGSTSLSMALEILGFTVIHDDEQPELTDVYDFWDEEEIDIDEVHEILGLRGYNATFKTADYEWVAKKEDVKAILTVRDNADKYVDSWMVAAPFIDILRSAPFKWFPTVETLLPSFESEFQNETTGGKPDMYMDRDALKETYNEYNSRVQEEIPEERLLTFNVKQGWKPLCEFLDVPVPEGIPFPHVHTRAKLEGEMFFLRMLTWIWPLVLMIPLHVALSLLGRPKLSPLDKTIMLPDASNLNDDLLLAPQEPILPELCRSHSRAKPISPERLPMNGDREIVLKPMPKSQHLARVPAVQAETCSETRDEDRVESRSSSSVSKRIG